MKFFMCMVVLFWLSSDNINAVPVSVSNNDISSNDVGVPIEDIAIVEDDITTRGLERLSSAATCLVAGIEYTHGQQIYRVDPCEFCLCLDGEMFCWWQDCPPTMEGPCRDRGPFTPCLSIPSSGNDDQIPLKPKFTKSTLSTTTTTSSTTLISSSSSITTLVQTTPSQSSSSSTLAEKNIINASREPIIVDSTFQSDTTSEYESATDLLDKSNSTDNNSKVCIVMGREYQIGDKLPHDTGNCIECICGQGAKVTCSPNQCAPAGEDINDYRPPGPRQPFPDVF